jgi:hypothetical protein
MPAPPAAFIPVEKTLISVGTAAIPTVEALEPHPSVPRPERGGRWPSDPCGATAVLVEGPMDAVAVTLASSGRYVDRVDGGAVAAAQHPRFADRIVFSGLGKQSVAMPSGGWWFPASDRGSGPSTTSGVSARPAVGSAASPCGDAPRRPVAGVALASSA